MVTGTVPSGRRSPTARGGGGGGTVAGGSISATTLTSVVDAGLPAAATVPSPALADAVTALGSAGGAVVTVWVTVTTGVSDAVVVVWPRASKEIVGGDVVGVAPDSD